MKTIRIGTRNSALALWQAHHVGALLATQGLGYEIVAITTKGDQILDRSLSKIGSKGEKLIRFWIVRFLKSDQREYLQKN
jgi:hydroxymethylbilane synthase